MKQIFRYTLLLLLLGSTACQPINEPTYPNTANGIMQALWDIIDTKYCYLETKQVDWQAVGDSYTDKLAMMSDTISQHDLFDLLASMLDSLNDGHVNLYSDFNVSRNYSWYENYPTNYDANLVYSARYLGDAYKIAGGFHYNLIAEGTVGYIRYSSFSSAFSTVNLGYMFQYFNHCNGLILDLRHNGGGSLSYAEQLAAAFFTEKTKVGYIQHKIGEGHSDFSDPEPMYIDPDNSYYKWEKTLVVLVNRNSYSATNFFANAIQHSPNAILMGGRSGGGGGMPLSYELPNGWFVRFSAVPMLDINLAHIEDGIDPDILINLTAEDYNQGYDTIIEEAIKQINQP